METHVRVDEGRLNARERLRMPADAAHEKQRHRRHHRQQVTSTSSGLNALMSRVLGSIGESRLDRHHFAKSGVAL